LKDRNSTSVENIRSLAGHLTRKQVVASTGCHVAANPAHGAAANPTPDAAAGLAHGAAANAVPGATPVAPKQGNEGIKFIPIPKQKNPEASRKRLAEYGLWLTKSISPLNRKLIVEYLLKLSVYEFQQDIIRRLSSSGTTIDERRVAVVLEIRVWALLVPDSRVNAAGEVGILNQGQIMTPDWHEITPAMVNQ
jgi:hypothetical protein